ncbi:MAG: S8 family serine peptidase [Rhodothermales bacterium]
MLVLLFLLSATEVMGAPGPGGDKKADDGVLPGVVVVQFKEGTHVSEGASKTGLASFDRIAALHQVDAVERAFPMLDVVAAKRGLTPSGVALQRVYYVRYGGPQRPRYVAAALAQDPHVAFAEPYFVRRIIGEAPAPAAEPNDPIFSSMDHLDQVDLPEAWDVVKGEQGDVVIAIVDGGSEWRHQDLDANIWLNPGETPGNGVDDDNNGFVDDVRGWNFADDSADPTGLPALPSNARHGTAVAGIASAVTDNGEGVSGSGWNAKTMIINASCPNQDDLICWGYSGIIYAALNGAEVINTSWGGPGRSEREQLVIDTAYEEGALVVAAATNEGVNSDVTPQFPAQYNRVLSVGSTGKSNDTKAGFSNYGRTVNVFAPGRSLNSTFPDGAYGGATGTSFSSPLVAGIAALVKTLHPEFTVDQLREQIRVTSDNVDDANPNFRGRMGQGRVNALRAVTETNNPAIRLTDLAYTVSGFNNDIDSGETVSLTATITNFLANASDVTVELVSADPFAVVTSGPVAVGALASGATVSVPLTFDVANDTPPGRTLILFTEVRSGAYTDADVIRLPANETSVASHASDALEVTITDEGNIGYLEFQGESQGRGFVTNGRDVLFEGGLVVAAGPTRISDSVRNVTSCPPEQARDFALKEGTTLEVISPAEFTSEQGQVELVDSLASSPIGLSIMQTSYLNRTPEHEDFIILKYAITNTTAAVIPMLYAGLFFDWDVNEFDAARDVARFDEGRQFGYIQDDASPTVLVGTKLLTTGAPLAYQAIDNTVTVYCSLPDGGFSDQEKWSILSGGVRNKQLSATDASQLTGAGPYSIDPGSTIEVAFAMVAGTSTSDLLQNVDNAQALWDNVISPTETSIDDDPIPVPGRFALHPVYPNPAVPPATLAFEVAEPSYVTLSVYDVLGREVQTVLAGRKNRGMHTVAWDGRDRAGRSVAGGLYLVRLTASGPTHSFSQSQQVVIVK